MRADKIVARASRRINMLKRIKGPGWGASVNIILSTDKVLIRPIIDYAPFATIIMNKALQSKLEKVQRAAIRIAIPWIPHTSASQIYKKINMKPILDRAYDLATIYIYKATISDNIINENISQYSTAGIKDNGAKWKKTFAPQYSVT